MAERLKNGISMIHHVSKLSSAPNNSFMTESMMYLRRTSTFPTNSARPLSVNLYSKIS